jgi:SOS response regulatory protein OraA/RecX
MKNEIQAKIYAETKDMSFEELKAYLAKRIESSPFGQRIIRQQKVHNYAS